jgi:pyruvate-ferredoxin/flavodoxin oxidoreductase
VAITTDRHWATIDGNEAAASVAYRLSEIVAIYPITPASPMGELADEWASERRPNLWGSIPAVSELQSEGGAIGAVHGALQAGSLATTFTASQGLLLMIPNLYKIAGELTPFVLHVAARSVATHALSIFGDHSDVMACRQTGMALLAAGSVQEAHDFACLAHAATLRSRVPFIHFFDGFRTSHELARIELLDDDDLRAMVDGPAVDAHRGRALTPNRPVLRGTAQNPDVFFQAREAANVFHAKCPEVVQALMDAFAGRVGRTYRLFDYVGHPEADRVLVMMGSGAETAHETVEWLVDRGERVGLVKVRLYRPFSPAHLVAALPATVSAIAVLDRTKEPGAVGEPLYVDVVSALGEAWRGPAPPRVIGGRYGLSSKEFTPAMVRAVFTSSPGRRLARTSPSVSWTTSRASRWQPTTSSTSSRTPSPAPCSTGWAPTARWVPTRTRSSSFPSGRASGRRAISCTTRRKRAHRPCPTCGSDRRRSDPRIWRSARDSSRATSSTSSTATTSSSTPRREPTCC